MGIKKRASSSSLCSARIEDRAEVLAGVDGVEGRVVDAEPADMDRKA